MLKRLFWYTLQTQKERCAIYLRHSCIISTFWSQHPRNIIANKKIENTMPIHVHFKYHEEHGPDTWFYSNLLYLDIFIHIKKG